MYLDSLARLTTEVGYGSIGLHGDLGYDGLALSVQGRRYAHAFSTHPPARIVVRLAGRFAGFRCHVAINDDVPADVSHADFAVLADGREVGVASFVRAGEPPRELRARIAGAERLELVVSTSRWECCHAVWLDPQVDEEGAEPVAQTVFDCLGRAEITVPATRPSAPRCLGTVVSPGFEHLLDDMLGSWYANARCSEALVVIFAINCNDECARIAAKYGAVLVLCDPRSKVNPMSKAILYSAARVIDAEQFLFLDADMLVLQDLRPVYAALEACPSGSLLACREGNNPTLSHLGQALRTVYGAYEGDSSRLGVSADEAAYSLVVNDGIFAGTREALLALDDCIRAMPQARKWVDERHDIWWRNQFIFNLALARLRCGVELDPSYNVQLHVQDVHLQQEHARVGAVWHGRPVRVLHFSGAAKSKYPTWRGRFLRVADPLVVPPGQGDAYGEFVSALRTWIGANGTTALTWSFYGLTNAVEARVRDATMLPLFGALHYLIRANGCVRVLETGTASGVSAACLASAVAHRDGGRVVTIDSCVYAKREELWAALPSSFRRVIEPRGCDSIQALCDALAAGERYDAILLDSLHTEEHVWAEFELAAQLVCPGGLILIHDACYANGTVEGALRRVEGAGYGVVRLWSADGGVQEDDHLGLAVVENRRRTKCAGAS
jgi:predicted O-methyltransferase YrrM